MSTRRVDGVASYDRGPSLVAIGNFDGIHAGHAAVLANAASAARARELVPVVLTFHPHPAEVLGRGARPPLTTIDRRVELIGRLDPSICVVVEPFTFALAQKSPREFALDLLRRELDARRVVVGKNFRFGRGRAGSFETLVELGAALSFEAHSTELVGDAHATFSSSRVREALGRGDLEEVRAVLGRPHSLSGVVVEGDRRGRTLGFPTANLGEIPEELPPHGVYACAIDLEGRALGTGVANLGVRPTVRAGPSFEVHLFDLDRDLYGAQLRVHLILRLRDERRFDGIEALRRQIAEDAREGRARLEGLTPDPRAAGAWF